MMLRRLALKTQLVDSALSNTTAGIHRNLDTGYSVWNALYGSMRRTLVQKAIKDSFVEIAYREELKYRM
jgi:hypothetical protein